LEVEEMKIVYIAGKFRGADAWEVHKNVQEALKVGFEVAYRGGMPLIPHSNTHPFDGTFEDAFWLQGTLELLRRCDAVMTISNWKASKGATAEVEEAKRLGIPVFEDLSELMRWLVSETIHVSVFEDDADDVPSIMMCGMVIEHDVTGQISIQGHDFYSLASMTESKMVEVSCGKCMVNLLKVRRP
jgi:hypothetical protein